MSRRFYVDYRLRAESEQAARTQAEWIRLEQSAELPAEVLADDFQEQFCGKIEYLQPDRHGFYSCKISFPLDLVGREETQFLNLLFGNISLGRGIQIVGLDWSTFSWLPGPANGISGVRKRLNVFGRALSCTALKPLGLPSSKLGKLCFGFARAGIDIIKDDHSLFDQSMAPFSERLRACQLAIKRAWEETGRKSAYFPNVTADGKNVLFRAQAAVEAGCAGVLISPHLSGLYMLPELRRQFPELILMAHPSFAGSLTADAGHGMTPGFLIGELWRALGADCCIYPNAGGRFLFTAEQCQTINFSCRTPSLPFLPCFPTPGGGIQASEVSNWEKTYGVDTIFLLGGTLYRDPRGIETAASEFCESLKKRI